MSIYQYFSMQNLKQYYNTDVSSDLTININYICKHN